MGADDAEAREVNSPVRSGFVPGSREEQEVAILREISQAIGETLVLEDVFEQIMDILAKGLKMKRGTLILRDRARGELRIAAAHGLSQTEKERGRYKVGEGITGRVVQTGDPLVIPDVSKDPRFLDRTGARVKDREKHPISFICLPLRVEEEVVGAVSVDRDYIDEEILARDQRLLHIVGSMISQAIKINRMVVLEKEALLAENLRLRRNLKSKYKFGNIIGASGVMQEVLVTAEVVARSNACVMIYGETGTGKELIANVIHHNSPRSASPLIKVNCGALSETLLESELFGHVKGAFTGATEQRQGRFEMADKGTIFLDEVASMTEKLQVKLLRVLQEKEFERVGSSQVTKVDVRVVAATNKNLEEEVRKGDFREDLFYRLNVVPVFLPPLRERREDIPLLIEHFLDKYNQENGKNVTKMSREVLDLLMDYDWPGNVRELENCIERAVVLSQTGTIPLDLLPLNIRTFKKTSSSQVSGDPYRLLSRAIGKIQSESQGRSERLHSELMRKVEEELIERSLRANDYNLSRAARELGICRNTLRKRMSEYGISSKS